MITLFDCQTETESGEHPRQKNDAVHLNKSYPDKKIFLFLHPEMKQFHYINSQIISVPGRMPDDHSLTHQALRDTVQNNI